MDIREEIFKVDHRITDQLSWAMIRNISSPVNVII